MNGTVLSLPNGDFEVFHFDLFAKLPYAEREKKLWLMASKDNRGKCFAIVDKAEALHRSLQ